MNLFKTLQVPEAQRYWIGQARVPICFLPGGPKTAVDRDGATLIDLLVDNEKIAAIEPAGVAASADLPAIDLEAHYVWPTLIDMHAHLDKGHIVTRTENPDGSFAGALKSTAEDRSHRWTAEDIKRRMEFGLRCAYVHGVAAIRTHLDSPELNQAQRSWAVFREVRSEWADRILLQAVALVPIDAFRSPYGEELADLVAASGGILGGVFTAIEAGAVACVWAFFVTMFVYRDYRWRDLPSLVHRTLSTVAMVMTLIACASSVGYVMALTQMPGKITAFFLTISSDKNVILFLINILLLVLGTLVDMAPSILIATPILLPVMQNFGVDPVHFGMIMLLNLGIGLCHPPVGSILFVGCAVGEVTIEQVLRRIWPFYGVMFFVLMLVTYIPAISLWLPHLLKL